MSWFDAAFSSLPDPRTGNAKRYDLLEVLTIALTAAVCGAESCSDFADFAVDREGLFREFLRLENGVPSHDTFSRIFRLLDPAAFATCFGRFVSDLGAAGAGVIAIDGKTLRRSFDGAARANPLAVVTAFASATRLVVGQESFRAAEGGSEILAARALLGCLDLTGHLVTADALHCQDETRRAWVSHEIDWMRGPKSACSEPALPPDMACLGMIEATVEQAGKITTTRHYHVSSRRLTAQAYLDAARAHWAVENSLHWVLDVTFDEDRARNRKDHGPENLTTLRKLALNILNRARPGISVRRKRKRSGWSDEFARSVIGQMR